MKYSQNTQAGQAACPSPPKAGPDLDMASVERAEAFFGGPERPFVYGNAKRSADFLDNSKPAPFGPNIAGSIAGRINVDVGLLVGMHAGQVANIEKLAADNARLRQKADALTDMNANQCQTILKLRAELAATGLVTLTPSRYETLCDAASKWAKVASLLRALR